VEVAVEDPPALLLGGREMLSQVDCGSHPNPLEVFVARKKTEIVNRLCSRAQTNLFLYGKSVWAREQVAGRTGGIYYFLIFFFFEVYTSIEP